MVRCHLECAVPVWFPYLTKDIEEVETVQRRATKMLACTKNMNYEERLRFLDLPTLVYRRHRGDMILTFAMINGLYDPDVIPTFVMRNGGNRGHSKMIYIQRSNTEIRANSFSRRVAPVWNSLTEKVVSSVSIDAFKIHLDELWKDHPMKFDHTKSVL